MALFNELYAIRAVEDGGIFAVLLAVVASYANPAVAGQPLLKVEELGVEHFLSAEDVGMLPQNLVADGRAALLPAVALDAVTLVLVANVIAAHGELLGCGAEAEQGAQQKRKDISHDSLVVCCDFVHKKGYRSRRWRPASMRRKMNSSSVKPHSEEPP